MEVGCDYDLLVAEEMEIDPPSVNYQVLPDHVSQIDLAASGFPSYLNYSFRFSMCGQSQSPRDDMAVSLCV